MKKVVIAVFVVTSMSASVAVLAQQRSNDMPGMGKGMAATAGAQTVHTATGVVKNLNPGAGTVTFAHEPVKSLNWPAMTMSFRVKDKGLLDKLKEGAKVQFDFVQDGSDYIVTAIK